MVDNLEAHMKAAGISGVWLCCSCDTGKPVFVKQHKSKTEMDDKGTVKIINTNPWDFPNSESAPELKCNSYNCGHKKCNNCKALRFIDQPGDGLASYGGISQKDGCIALRLSCNGRHFKCDIPPFPPKIDNYSTRNSAMGQDSQLSSVLVPFPEFRQYKKRENNEFWDSEGSEASDSEPKSQNPTQAPTATPQARETAKTKAVLPQDPPRSSISHATIFPWVKGTYSETLESSEPSNSIPNISPQPQHEDIPSSNEGKWTPYSFPGSAQNGETNINYMSPGFKGRVTYTPGQGYYEGNMVSDSGRAHYGTITNGDGIFGEDFGHIWSPEEDRSQEISSSNTNIYHSGPIPKTRRSPQNTSFQGVTVSTDKKSAASNPGSSHHQDNSPQSREPSSSSPAVPLRKRPVSPAIRVAKIIRR